MMKQMELPKVAVTALAALVGVAISASATIPGTVVYLMDDSVTTDSSAAGGYDGVLHNGPTLSTDVPPIGGAGYAGNRSMAFSGTEDPTDPHIRIVDTSAGDAASALDLALTDLTIEAWIKPDQARNMTLFQDAGVRNFNNKSIGVRWLTADQNARWTLQIADGTQPVNLFSPADSVPMGEWTHVAARLDRAGNLATIHINGLLAASADASGVSGQEIHDNGPSENMVQAVGGEFYGAGINTTQGWGGLIDEFRLTTTVLTPAEIRRNSQHTLVPEPGTFALLALGGLLALRRRMR
jgi:hypothetical protein